MPQPNTTNTVFNNGLEASRFFNIPVSDTPDITEVKQGALNYFPTDDKLAYWNGNDWLYIFTGTVSNTLQQVTGVGNTTTYGIQVTGSEAIDESIDSLAIFANSGSSYINNLAEGIVTGGISFFTNSSVLKAGTTNLVLNTEQDTTTAGVVLDTRISFSDGINITDGVTLGQLNTAIGGIPALTFSNGLRQSGTDVKLGLDVTTLGTTNIGQLTDPLNLISLSDTSGLLIGRGFGTANSSFFRVSPDTSISFDRLINNNNQSILFRQASQGNLMVLSDQVNLKGLEEAADYSVNKTDYSYVTKKMLTEATNIPFASRTVNGIVSTSNQDFKGAKSFYNGTESSYSNIDGERITFNGGSAYLKGTGTSVIDFSAPSYMRFYEGGSDFAFWSNSMSGGAQIYPNKLFVGRNLTNTTTLKSTALAAASVNGTTVAANSNASDLVLQAGSGLGTSTVGDIIFQTANVTTSGTTQQAYTTKMTLSKSGNLSLNTTPATSTAGTYKLLTRNTTTGTIELTDPIDISGKANLAGGNNFTGPQTFTGTFLQKDNATLGRIRTEGGTGSATLVAQTNNSYLSLLSSAAEQGYIGYQSSGPMTIETSGYNMDFNMNPTLDFGTYTFKFKGNPLVSIYETGAVSGSPSEGPNYFVTRSELDAAIVTPVSTNLSLGTRTTTTLPINNSNGTGVTLPAATTSLAGLLTSADKTKLDGIDLSGKANLVGGNIFTGGTQSIQSSNAKNDLTSSVIALTSDASGLANTNAITASSIDLTEIEAGVLTAAQLSPFAGLFIKTNPVGSGLAGGAQLRADLITTSTKSFQFPNASGTLALTSDLTAKQNTVTLTTTGSGAATFNSSTGALNIPTPPAGNSGTVTNVSSANANIVVTNPTTTPQLTLASTITSNTSGSAATLTTSRNINGVAFNGSADITIATASNLANGTVTATTYPITNSNGTGVTLAQATTTLAGVLNATDKVKINTIPTGGETLNSVLVRGNVSGLGANFGTTNSNGALKSLGGTSITALTNTIANGNTVFQLADNTQAISVGQFTGGLGIIQAVTTANAARPITLNPFGGNVGINIAAANPAVALDVNGIIRASTAPVSGTDVVRLTELNAKQNTVALTTTGTGAATFNSSTGALNIPTPDLTGYVNTTGDQTGILGNKVWSGNQIFNGTVTATNGIAVSGGQAVFSSPQFFWQNVLGTHAQMSFDNLGTNRMRGRFVLNKRNVGNISAWAIIPPETDDNGADFILPANTNGGTFSLREDLYRFIASGTGSSTTINIPHGLPGISASSDVIVQPKNAASAGVSYATITSTNIVITYTVAPVAGTNNLSYAILIRP